ncbi:MAG: hypothetical protein IJZ51_03335 [Ruminiclostridium sp.]|nr:hypothetical protein [Ruminiclostridium sp.]
MKKIIAILIFSAMLTGCTVGSNENNSLEISSSTFEEESSPYDTSSSIVESVSSSESELEEIKYHEKIRDVKKVTDSVQEDFEKCKTADFKNLNLSNTFVSCESREDISFITISLSNSAFTATDKENYATFKKYCEKIFGEFDVEHMLIWSGADEFSDEKIFFPLNASEYKEHLERDNHDIYITEYSDKENNAYLWWYPATAVPHWIVKGDIYDTGATVSSDAHCLSPSSIESELVESYVNDGSCNDVSYSLPFGDVTIGEAVDYFENHYLSDLYEGKLNNLSLKVNEVKVHKISGEHFYYLFDYSVCYNGIPYDGNGEIVTYADISSKYTLSGEAVMLGADNVDIVTNMILLPVTKTNQVEGIISLYDAVQIASEKLSDKVVFDVNKAELIYAGDRNTELLTASLSPKWKFTLLNPNDGKFYATYVDAVSGEFEYFSYTK